MYRAAPAGAGDFRRAAELHPPAAHAGPGAAALRMGARGPLSPSVARGVDRLLLSGDAPPGAHSSRPATSSLRVEGCGIIGSGRCGSAAGGIRRARSPLRAARAQGAGWFYGAGVKGSGGSARRCPVCDQRLSPRALARAVYCSTRSRALAWRRGWRTRVRAAAVKAGLTAVCPVSAVSWLVGAEHRAQAVYWSAACRARGWRRWQVAAQVADTERRFYLYPALPARSPR